MAVGWQLASHVRTSLTIDALDTAVTGGHVSPAGVCDGRSAVAEYLEVFYNRQRLPRPSAAAHHTNHSPNTGQ